MVLMVDYLRTCQANIRNKLCMMCTYIYTHMYMNARMAKERTAKVRVATVNEAKMKRPLMPHRPHQAPLPPWQAKGHNTPTKFSDKGPPFRCSVVPGPLSPLPVFPSYLSSSHHYIRFLQRDRGHPHWVIAIPQPPTRYHTASPWQRSTI